MDPDYQRAASRYLLFLAAASLIASPYVGVFVAALVWALTAFGVLSGGKDGQKHPSGRRRRRRPKAARRSDR